MMLKHANSSATLVTNVANSEIFILNDMSRIEIFMMDGPAH